jgi:hypothetical protein
MHRLKQHLFRSALHGTNGTCIYCGADFEEDHSPCDHALESAPDYFEPDDPRWQAEEADNAHS